MKEIKETGEARTVTARKGARVVRDTICDRVSDIRVSKASKDTREKGDRKPTKLVHERPGLIPRVHRLPRLHRVRVRARRREGRREVLCQIKGADGELCERSRTDEKSAP